MKRKNFIILLIFVLSLLVSCCWGPKEKADSEIFTSIEPMEWSEDYVVSLTSSSNVMQIWDTETKTLVENISFIKESRCLSILDVAILDKAIWLIGVGKSYNLIRIDVSTGVMEYKDFSFEGCSSRPYRIQAISKEEDGIGTLWVKSYGSVINGTLFACYNSNGTLRDSFEIKCDIESTPMDAIYKNEKYYLLGASLERIKIGDQSQECFTLLNLTDKTVTKIRNAVFFDDGFFEREYEGIDIIDFITNVKVFRNKKISINVVNSAVIKSNNSLADRLYYTITNFDPFEVEYSNLKFEYANIVDFFEDDNFEYILLSPKNTEGFEIKLFDKKTKQLLKSLEIENVISTCVEQNNSISNNVTWITVGRNTEPAIPEICKLDHETGRVFVYSEDGTERELFYTDVSE